MEFFPCCEWSHCIYCPCKERRNLTILKIRNDIDVRCCTKIKKKTEDAANDEQDVEKRFSTKQNSRNFFLNRWHFPLKMFLKYTTTNRRSLIKEDNIPQKT